MTRLGRVLVAATVIAFVPVGPGASTRAIDVAVAANATPAWSVVPSPSRPAPVPYADLRAVACPTPTSCIAVGARESSLFAMRLSGATWSVMKAPSLPKQGFGELFGMACPTTTKCFAVGSYWDKSAKALIERWDGTSWSVSSIPRPSGTSVLEAIACPTSSSCFALGYSSRAGSYRTLIEHWNGKTWAMVGAPTPNPTDSSFGQFKSIACPTSNSCIAVGASNIAGYRPSAALAMQWNGKAWSLLKPVKPAGDTASWLTGISCATRTTCFAVGSYWKNYRTYTLVQRWNGSRWSIDASVGSPGHTLSRLAGVSCPAANRCFAAGNNGASDQGGGATSPIVEQWNGAAWSLMPTPASNTTGSPTAIACPTIASCVAVGATLMQKWNGTSWSNVLTGRSTGTLYDVECTSSIACFAVGSYADYSVAGPHAPYRNKTMIQRWDGTSWKIIPSPDLPGPKFDMLAGISCPTSTLCFAVGTQYGYYGPVGVVLIAKWDGTSWSLVPTPARPGVAWSSLAGISCLDATTCYAVGTDQIDSDTVRSLVERWDGTAWSVVPGGSFPGVRLNAIACTSAASCMTVGSGDAIAVRMDGASWSIAARPREMIEDDALAGISCPTATTCLAVGSTTGYDDNTDARLSAVLTERWDGTRWSIVPTPNFSSPAPALPAYAGLYGVSCSGPTSCTAVGSISRSGTGHPNGALIEEWDGAAWSAVDSPNMARRTFSALYGVSCVPGPECVAVGSSFDEYSTFPLVERRS